MNYDKYRKNLNFIRGVFIPTILYGGFVGVVTGSVIFVFHHLAEAVINTSVFLYSEVAKNLRLLPLMIVCVVFLAFSMYFLIKKAPNAKGVGIPRSQGVVRGLLPIRWVREFFATFFGSLVSFMAGVPLGIEGPSVFIGTTIGAGSCSLPICKPAYYRYMMMCGSSAGFAASCKAPLTALLFSFEELNRKLSPMFVVLAFSSVVSASITTDILVELLGETHSFFTFGEIATLDIIQIWIPIVCGLCVGLVACLFNFCVFLTGKLGEKFDSNKFELIKIISIFVVVGFLGVFLSDSVHSGSGIIAGVMDSEFTIRILVLMFVIRFIMVSFASTSGVIGGVFIPVLSIGAILGGIMGYVLLGENASNELYRAVALMSIAAFMSGTLQVPLTATVFIMESTHSFDNALFLIVGVFVSYVVSKYLKIDSLYDVILEKMIARYRKDKTMSVYRCEMRLKNNAFAIGRYIGDIFWPQNTIVRLICTEDATCMDYEGTYKLRSGDKLLLQFQTCELEETIEQLKHILGDGEAENLREVTFENTFQEVEMNKKNI